MIVSLQDIFKILFFKNVLNVQILVIVSHAKMINYVINVHIFYI